MRLARPRWATAACHLAGSAPLSGSAANVSQARALVSAMSRWLRRAAQRTCTVAKPKRRLLSFKRCSIQPRCRYHAVARLAAHRLVASYHGSVGGWCRGWRR